MSRLITTRFPAKCRKCGGTIPAHSRAYWRKGYGSTHESCEQNKAPIPRPANIPTVGNKPPAPKLPTAEITGVVDFADVKQGFLDATRGKNPCVKNASGIETLLNSWTNETSFIGADIFSMQRWLENGYKVEGLRNVSPSITPNRKRRRLVFAEEGEMLIDEMMSGSDFPFLQWEQRERKPGMRVNIGYNFFGSVAASVIADYALFVAKTLAAIEEMGIDAEVNVYSRGYGRYEEKGTKRSLTETLIRVKKENEATDFTQWSAILAPSGFRHLVWTSYNMIGDQLGLKLTYGYGSPAWPADWQIQWDDESRTLAIMPSAKAASFPMQAMSDQARTLLNTIVR
jgi:hypothetical protein